MPYPFLPASRRHALAVLFSAAALLSACGGGGQRDEVLDPTLLNENQRLQDQATAAVDTTGLAGIVIGSQYRSADKLYRARAGQRRLHQGPALSGDEAFGLGSLGKSMTAMVAARLVEQGRLRWDSHPADLIPALAGLQHPAYAAITLEQLLNHRAGLAYGGEQDLLAFLAARDAAALPDPGSPPGRRQAVLTWALQQPPAGKVGDFLYSNIGYELAAWMLEAASGVTFESLLERELGRPFGMTLAFHAPANAATGHAGATRASLQAVALPATLETWLDALQGSGGQWLSAADYARWLREHQRALQGEGSLLPQGYVQRIQALGLGEYALGWQGAGTAGMPLLIHSGGVPGFTSLTALRRDGTGATFAFSNTQATSEGADWVGERLNAALLAVLQAH